MAYWYRLFQLRFFLFSLVHNDIRNRYRRSFLGVAWSLLRPLGMTAVVCIVFCPLFHQKPEVYAPLVFIGMTIWQFLVESIISGCSSFAVGAPYIRQQPIPLALFPLRTVLVAGFHAAIALLTAFAIILFFKHQLPSAMMVVSLLPVLVLLFLLGWSFATVFGALHTHFPDTQHLLEIVLQTLFYLTPVMYDPEQFKDNATLSRIMSYNPFAAIMALFRQPLLHGTVAAAHCWLMALCFLATMGTLSWLILRKFQRELVFWV